MALAIGPAATDRRLASFPIGLIAPVPAQHSFGFRVPIFHGEMPAGGIAIAVGWLVVVIVRVEFPVGIVRRLGVAGGNWLGTRGLRDRVANVLIQIGRITPKIVLGLLPVPTKRRLDFVPSCIVFLGIPFRTRVLSYRHDAP